MTVVRCRSYPAQTFDGCSACISAALDAIGQAGIFVLGRAAPGLTSQAQGPLEMTYLLRVKLFDDLGERIGSDEIEAEQTIEAVDLPDEADQAVGEHGDGGEEAEGDTSMRLEDFQTVLDRLELSQAGPHGLCGSIAGHLYAFQQLVGTFEIEVVRARSSRRGD